MDSLLPCKRLADGSKRVRVPHFLSAQVTIYSFSLNWLQKDLMLYISVNLVVHVSFCSHPTTIRSEEGLRGRNAMCLCSESDRMSRDIPVAPVCCHIGFPRLLYFCKQ